MIAVSIEQLKHNEGYDLPDTVSLKFADTTMNDWDRFCNWLRITVNALDGDTKLVITTEENGGTEE